VVKTCCTCKLDKNLDEFHLMSSSKDGHHYRCKSCKKELNKKYRQRHQTKLLAKKKEYREANKEKISESKKKCYRAKRDEYLQKRRTYWHENKDWLNEKQKEYYEANKPELIKKMVAYRKNKYHSNSSHRIRMNLSRGICKVLKNTNVLSWNLQ